MSTPNHRTARASSYFVTTKCCQGRSLFRVKEIADILLQTILGYRDAGAYLLHEFVIMPNHLHLLLTPGQEASLEKAVQLIKGGSSFRIHRARGHKMELWQAGFFDWTVRDSQDWKAKVAYIHMNPVRAGLVLEPWQWPHSSASGTFSLDGIPERYSKKNVTSVAKAPDESTEQTRGLKPPPPKEEGKELKRVGLTSVNVCTAAEARRFAQQDVPQRVKV
jgi:putative transposase